VLFFFQKANYAVLYLRRQNTIYAWSSICKSVGSELFRNPGVLVLLDPREADRGGAEFPAGKVSLVYVASNNKVHISSDALKNNPDMQVFLGPPLDNELPVILQRLDSTLSKELIDERKATVGNLIRYISSEKQYRNRVAAIDAAVDQCSEDTKFLAKALQMDGMADGQQTVPGTLFQVLPARPTLVTAIGYDGHNVNYRERVVVAATAKVSNAISTASRKLLISYWGKTSSGERARMGDLVEKLFINDLTNRKRGMVITRYLQGQNQESELVIQNRMTVKDEVKIENVCASVLEKNNVVAKIVTGGKLIDAAGPGRKVYQVTVSRDHEMNVSALYTICEELGYILQDGTIARENEARKLEFHWVVPMAEGTTWKKKAPYKYNPSKDDKDKKKKEIVNRCLKRHIDQYVLPLPYEIPVSFSDWKKRQRTA
jgi:hypothetical protein